MLARPILRMPDRDPNKDLPDLPFPDSAGAAEREALSPARLAELSRAAAAGDHGALAQLHARFSPGLLRLFLKRTRGRDDLADDLAQRCWTLAWESIRRGKYDPDRASMSTFVYAVANNVWLQHLRKTGRSLEISTPAPLGEGDGGARGPGRGLGESDFDGAFASDLGEAELLQAVRDAVGGLSDHSAAHAEGSKGRSEDAGFGGGAVRAATGGAAGGAGLSEEERSIVRMTAAGMSDRTVASRLGLAPSTVNVKKRGAFEKIRRFLASRGHRGWEE